MDTGRIDRVDRMDARHHGRDDWPGQLVNDGPARGVLLRGPANDGERPDRAVTVPDVLDIEDRKRMRQRVVAEVVAEWSLGQLLVGIDGAGDAEVGLAGDRRRAGSSAGRRDQQDAVPAEGTSK